MKGVAGYATDMADAIGYLTGKFRGGVVVLPGVPVLMGGTDDETVIRALVEFGRWLSLAGEQHPKATWQIFTNEILSGWGGNTFQTEKFRHEMPESLRNNHTYGSWVSGGWASPCGANPASPDSEQLIVRSLVKEINCLYNLSLGEQTVHDRLVEKSGPDMPRFVLIGGSHAINEAKALVDRGHEVITCAVGGWKPNKTASNVMATAVQEVCRELCEDDIIVLHCCDNIAFMSRTEEGGDLPIRQFPNGKFHVDGDLLLAGRDRLHMYFKNMIPILKNLENRKVIFLTPMPRYVHSSCCNRADHTTNREEEGFEAGIVKGLTEVRGFYKDFLFTSGFRGFVVLNPGLSVPAEDESGTKLWGRSPVHPLHEGYNRIADLICEEAVKLLRRSKKRPGEDTTPPPAKKPRLELPRPRWVEASTSAVVSHGWADRGRGGQGGGRGQWPYFPSRGGWQRGAPARGRGRY
jgi:hypothetical protein